MTVRKERKQEKYLYRAERYYVRRAKTIPEIAAILPVSTSTLSRWRLKYDWDWKREEYQKGPAAAADRIMDQLFRKLEKLAQKDEISSTDAQVIANLLKATHQAEVNADRFGSAIIVLSDMVDFLQEKMPEMLDQFERILPRFEDWLRAKYD